MKIERIEVHKTKWEMKDIGSDTTSSLIYEPGATQEVSAHAIKIITDEGVTGEYVGGNTVGATQIGMMSEYLIGQDPLKREQIHNDVKRALRKYDKMGMGPLDIALWDLAGKYYGAPIYQLLGGWRTKLPAYASTFTGDRNGGLDCPQAYADFAVQCKEMGYPGFKLHVWENPGVDEIIGAVTAVRKAVGDSMVLMLDPASKINTWTDAYRIGKACDDNGYLWYEDPYKDSSVSAHGHNRLKGLLTTPLMITEHIRGLEQKVDFIATGATDYARMDAEYDGGITGAIKVAHAAEGFGLDVEMHSPMPAHRHIMASIRNSNFYEMSVVHPKTTVMGRSMDVYACDYRDGLDAIDENGCVTVPDGPGLGVTYDWDAINAHRVDTKVYR
ncbi:enolase C-terminal domain-like protein [Nocardia jinanensis]|uniref:glucarate dehydratase n=1 Tax=Nocardia jinanensis TaxID=382504 RepID=A0A917RJ23_9NOCA|nr:enolase C-terminal domain-like protein [Nocardia jinanensis]GGL10817.1 mandelate racemase [Nocardia jinanensis]